MVVVDDEMEDQGDRREGTSAVAAMAINGGAKEVEAKEVSSKGPTIAVP